MFRPIYEGYQLWCEIAALYLFVVLVVIMVRLVNFAKSDFSKDMCPPPRSKSTIDSSNDDPQRPRPMQVASSAHFTEQAS